MKRNSLITALVILVAGLYPSVSGSWQWVPKAEFPAQVHRRFKAPFDKTWDVAIQTARNMNGIIIIEDRPSRLIVFALPEQSGGRTYISVYLKSNPRTNTTFGFFASHRYAPPQSSNTLSRESENQALRDFISNLNSSLGGL